MRACLLMLVGGFGVVGDVSAGVEAACLPLEKMRSGTWNGTITFHEEWRKTSNWGKTATFSQDWNYQVTVVNELSRDGKSLFFGPRGSGRYTGTVSDPVLVDAGTYKERFVTEKHSFSGAVIRVDGNFQPGPRGTSYFYGVAPYLSRPDGCPNGNWQGWRGDWMTSGEGACFHSSGKSIFHAPVPAGLSGEAECAASTLHGSVSSPITNSLNQAIGQSHWSWNFAYSPGDVEHLEVVVDPQDYKSWVPTAGRDELTPGDNPIKVRAILQTKDGKTATAKRFKFELVDVSHEPGVSLNYPLGNRVGNVNDLQFDPQLNSELTVRPSPPVPQGSNQTAETPEGNYSEAEVVISSYDWGAWGTLKVTADLADGSTITGHLKGDPSRTNIFLPKRQDNSKIADAWKDYWTRFGHDVTNLPDDDDSEDEPVGDGSKGDGLSLYEEYRGFHENGVHERGNPWLKDFFVVNEIGKKAQDGISVFEGITRLKVRSELRKEELGNDRCINCNHGYAHVVNQHGVRLTRGDLSFTGGQTQPGPGTPGHVERIVIHLGRRLGSTSSRRLFDHVIAHELLHSVNVWHHGERDIRWVEWKADTWQGSPAVIETQFNDHGQPTVSHPVNVYEDQKPIPPETYADGTRLWVAREGGQHSGDLSCLMRYDVADAYAPQSDEIQRRQWLSKQEKEEPGLNLCTVHKGTIWFGDASDHEEEGPPTRGDCKHQIRVSDR